MPSTGSLPPASRSKVQDRASWVGPGCAQSDHLLQSQQPADNDGAVGPRAGPGGDQPVAARLDRPAGFTVRAGSAVPGDAVLDVVGVPVEVAAGDVGALGAVRFRALQFCAAGLRAVEFRALGFRGVASPAVCFDCAGLLTHGSTLCCRPKDPRHRLPGNQPAGCHHQGEQGDPDAGGHSSGAVEDVGIGGTATGHGGGGGHWSA